jgi:hypothetical protein
MKSDKEDITMYLLTVEDLYKNAAQMLGCMDQGTFDSFVQKAEEEARQSDMRSPIIGIDIRFKPGEHGFTIEYPHSVTRDEWDRLLEESKTWNYTPDVYLIDGEEFAIPS